MVAANNPATFTSAPLTNSATTISVVNGASFSSYFVAQIDAELIRICGNSGTVLTVCSGGRGWDGTAAVAHLIGRPVNAPMVKDYQVNSKNEIEAVEQYLSTFSGTGGGSSTYNEGSTNAVNRPVSEKLGDMLAIGDFCADGTTDFAACAQNAINRANALGKTLRFPAGAYPLSAQLNLGTNGTSTNLGIWCDSGATFTPSAGFSGYSLMQIVGTNITVTGCAFSDPGSVTTNGITVQGSSAPASDIYVRGCSFLTIQYGSFQVFNANGVWFEQNRIYTGTTMAGGSIIFANDTSASVGYSDVHILGTKIYENTTQAVESIVLHSQYCTASCVSDLEVAQNQIYKTGSNFGIEIQGVTNTVATVIRGANVHDNYCKYMGTGATYNGFISLANATQSTVNRNIENKNGNYIALAMIEIPEISSFIVVSENVSLGSASQYSNAIASNCAANSLIANNVFYNSGIYVGSSSTSVPNCDETRWVHNSLYGGSFYLQANASTVHINHNIFLDNYVYGGGASDGGAFQLHNDGFASGSLLNGTEIRNNHVYNAQFGIASYNATYTISCGNYFDGTVGQVYSLTGANSLGDQCDQGQPFSTSEPGTFGSPVTFSSSVTAATINTNLVQGTLAAPVLTALTNGVTGSGDSDALAAGTYTFCVSAVTSGSLETACSNVLSTTLTGPGRVSLTWTAVPGATSYKMWQGGLTAQYFYGTLATSGTSFSNLGYYGFTNAGHVPLAVGSAVGGPLIAPSLQLLTAHTPATSSENCLPGIISWDASYWYVCTSTNTWKRTALSSF